MKTDLSPRAEQIVASAQTLLASGGYNSWSYAHISEMVNISKASIHHHFSTKAELVQTVVSRHREDTLAGISTLTQHVPDPLAQLQAYTGHWAARIGDASSSVCICTMLAADMPAIPSQVAEEVRGHFLDLTAWVSSVLTTGAEQGIFTLTAAPETEAMAFVATVHGAMLSARVYGDPQVFALIVQPLIRRLTSQQ